MKSTPTHDINTRSFSVGNTVRDLIRINPRFRRSVQIELDLNDRTSTESYVATDFVTNCLKRISVAFERGSSQRAWRITGDYGSGKSAFTLALAKAAEGRDEEIPARMRGIISEKAIATVVVTGDREPIVRGIGRAVIGQVAGLKGAQLPTTTEELLTLLATARKQVKKNGAKGILLILDELGKNLEYSTLEPQNSDVYSLQRLAEFASRSGDNPLIVLGILHQGISSYTADMDTATRREWDKVAGRFDEIIFAHPLEQTVQLCAEALNIDTGALPDHILHEARQSMKWAVDSGLYGSSSTEILTDLAPRLFPLHPTVLPPLLTILRRFAQNERSLFGFLTGYEPKSLQEHAGVSVDQAKFFRLVDLYEYFRANLSYMMTNGKATHWRIIESVVRQASGSEATDLATLKSIGILNLIDDDSLLATKEMIQESVGRSTAKNLNKALELLKKQHVLYERGSVRGYSLWPHTSVHLTDCFEDARRQLGEPADPMRMVTSLLEIQTIVARRHYIETGNLRHFEAQFHPAKDYEHLCAKGLHSAAGANPDGYALLLFPENDREFMETSKKLVDPSCHPGSNVIVGLLRPPIELLGAAKDLQCWKWVRENIRELAGDEYARQELKSQIRNSTEMLENRKETLTGLNVTGGEAFVDWFWRAERIKVGSNGIGAHLSYLCDILYPECPVVTNELINRRVTSSTASRARTLLLEAMSSHPDKPFLGLDDSKNPPEIAIYISVLLAGGVHSQDKNGWGIKIPDEKMDKCRLRPALFTIERLLKNNESHRMSVSQIFDELRKEPIGARDGILPILLAIYLGARWHQTAAYEDGTYKHRLGGEEFQRLIKEPECFELQRCAIEGVRLDVFHALSKVLGLEERANPEILDVVRPLVKFIVEAPEYCRNTLKLSREALALRKCLLEARDPASLVFTEIPLAVGLASSDHEALAAKLPKLIVEIQISYDRLLERLALAITDSFETISPIREFRTELTYRCRAISGKLADTELKSFVLRLGDDKLEYRNWLESLANHLSRRSATRWHDNDEEVFHQRMGILVKRMLRAEAANSDIIRHPSPENSERVVWLALTKPNGIECTQLLHWTKSEENKVLEIERQIKALIHSHGRVGLSAVARALWSKIEND